MLYNLYRSTNYYGNNNFSIAAENAMPAKYDKIIYTGSLEDCNKKYVSELAYYICNETNAKDWSIVYETAWNILYKGKPTKEQQNKIAKLQYDNYHKMNYCPMDLLLKIRSLLTMNKKYCLVI